MTPIPGGAALTPSSSPRISPPLPLLTSSSRQHSEARPSTHSQSEPDTHHKSHLSGCNVSPRTSGAAKPALAPPTRGSVYPGSATPIVIPQNPPPNAPSQLPQRPCGSTPHPMPPSPPPSLTRSDKTAAPRRSPDCIIHTPSQP
ncbi:hypothetical protein K466DRAFT_178815 [Polyporus arcularius HHB13444]|uniref:Uncharacterized protein n=1 Tax=Polyporus arcularius HHB13444 TaxID=1314778 RepID=A0A5C3PA10_9APHY|nr:hypothetical protein K466DRAFT_178815 [Polyporus arcularius HHB13444]